MKSLLEDKLYKLDKNLSPGQFHLFIFCIYMLFPIPVWPIIYLLTVFCLDLLSRFLMAYPLLGKGHGAMKIKAI